MDKIIFKDKAGNKIIKRYIKTRKVTQYIAKNAQGKLVNPSGFNILAKRAGLTFGKVKKKGITKTVMYKK